MRNRFDRLKREEMGEEEWQRAKEEERQGKPQSRWTQKEDDLLIKVSHPVQTRGLHPTAGNLNDEADPHPPNSKLQRSSATKAKTLRRSPVSSRAGRWRP